MKKPTPEENPPNDDVTLADFSPALKLLRETQTPYCLVGGLAVGQWAEEFLKPDEKESFDLPIRSKGIDLRAEKETAIILTLHLRAAGATAFTGILRKPKNPSQSFPPYAATLELAATEKSPAIKTTIEALAGMPLLDEYQDDLSVKHNGTVLLYKDIYLLDPCSLLICKLNAINTRPPGQSDNDRKHATILSLVIPRFITKTLARNAEGKDPYHPGEDAARLTSFLNRDPWNRLIPDKDKTRTSKACRLANADWELRQDSNSKNP